MPKNNPLASGLHTIRADNATAKPNSELLATLRATFPQFLDRDGAFKTDKFLEELKASNITEARDGYRLGFVGKDYARL